MKAGLLFLALCGIAAGTLLVGWSETGLAGPVVFAFAWAGAATVAACRLGRFLGGR